MSYTIKWHDKGVCKEFEGEVTGQEIYKAVQEVEGDARFDNIQYVLNDFSKINGFLITERDLDKIAAIDKAAAISNPGILIANVLNSEEIFAMAELYGQKIEDSEYSCRNFMDINAAWAWILDKDN